MEQILDDIVLLDEDGGESRFEHILTFLYEGERYIALSPIADENAAMEEDEAEIVLLRVAAGADGDTYERIESPVLLDEVFAHFLELMDELEEEAEKGE